MAQRVLHLIPYTPQMGAGFIPYESFEDQIWNSQITPSDAEQEHPTAAPGTKEQELIQSK